MSTVLKNLKIESHFIPDPVFGLSSIIKSNVKNDVAVILPFSFDDVYKIYNPSKMNSESFLNFWQTKIKDTALKYKEVIVTVTDILQDIEIFEELQKANHTANVRFVLPQKFTDLITIISTSKYVYSGRMHALIIGYSYNCICESFDVSQKLEIFKNEVLDNKENSIEKSISILNKEIDLIKIKFLENK
jgi:polysaccharide pyruvyl transferase WcaK-like protein